MSANRACRAIACLLIGIVLAGCNSFQGSFSETDAEFDDLELDLEGDAAPVAKKPKPATIPTDEEGDPDALELPAAGELGLRLAVGDRFPLLKTLEQRLTQPGEHGPATGASRLDVLMSLAVEEIRDGQTRFAVRYHGVRYREQDLDGNVVEYDSAQPPGEVPPQALAYAGLVNNGFSFWLGPDNRLIDLVGFRDFVQRCLRDVPPAYRQAVVDQLSAANGTNGIASFIDDSIGLLPVSSDSPSKRVAVQEGTAWELPVRSIDGPVPLQVATQCRIKGLTERTAEIDLFGSIGAARHIDPQHGWKITVLGGRCLGSCTVDRRTGVPTNSLVQRYVDLILELPDGTELKQRKEIVSTITAYLHQDRELEGRATDVVTPAAHQDHSQRAEPRQFGREPRRFEPDAQRLLR
jgi:hypothetical protein